jgi:hypothetical protein
MFTEPYSLYYQINPDYYGFNPGWFEIKKIGEIPENQAVKILGALDHCRWIYIETEDQRKAWITPIIGMYRNITSDDYDFHHYYRYKPDRYLLVDINTVPGIDGGYEDVELLMFSDCLAFSGISYQLRSGVFWVPNYVYQEEPAYVEIANAGDVDLLIAFLYRGAYQPLTGQVRHVYLRADDQIRIEGLAPGEYEIFLMSGSEWIPEKYSFLEQLEFWRVDGPINIECDKEILENTCNLNQCGKFIFPLTKVCGGGSMLRFIGSPDLQLEGYSLSAISPGNFPKISP